MRERFSGLMVRLAVCGRCRRGHFGAHNNGVGSGSGGFRRAARRSAIAGR
jgi:hypothetical protein